MPANPPLPRRTASVSPTNTIAASAKPRPASARSRSQRLASENRISIAAGIATAEAKLIEGGNRR